jgi:protoporphyrinogen oxidase
MTMENNRYDVIVIGSGPGGSSSAALLQRQGYRTLLVEKNNILGGKMASIEKDGYAYDLFPHGQVPMRQPSFEALFRELGVGDEFEPALAPDDPRDVIKICYRRRDWKEPRIAPQGQAMADPTPFFKLWDLGPEDQKKAVDFMAGLVTLPEEKLDDLDNVSMHEYIPTRSTATWRSTRTPRSPSRSTSWRPRSRSASSSRSCFRAEGASTRAASVG